MFTDEAEADGLFGPQHAQLGLTQPVDVGVHPPGVDQREQHLADLHRLTLRLRERDLAAPLLTLAVWNRDGITGTAARAGLSVAVVRDCVLYGMEDIGVKQKLYGW